MRLEAQLRSAEATLANARSEFRMAEQLIRTRAISRLEFERAETAVSVAQENQEAARVTLEAGLIAREEDVDVASSSSVARAPYVGPRHARVVALGLAYKAEWRADYA